MSEPFPIEQFRDVFQITPKIKNKLQPFLAQYKNLNMDWIINSLEEIHKYFFEEKIDITLKFNSIFAIKFLFDSAEVVLVNLIEIYFLPKIFEIACFDAKTNEEKRGTGYFASAGYPKETPDIEKLSYNFVRLSSEFIQAAAAVKPKKLYLYEEQDEHSDYHDAFLRLQELGWKPYAKLAYYKETVPAIMTQFKKNLADFDAAADPYIDFYSDVFKINLQKGKMYQGRINPKKVLESGDVYITGSVIELCIQAFKSKFIKERLNGLHLLNQFIKWGDIEAAYHINCSNMMDDTLLQIANTGTGSEKIVRGKSLFVKLEGNQDLKQQFYVEILKSIQFWSLCFPRALKVKNRDSKIKQAHDQLRMKLKMEFPQDKHLKDNKLEFDRNIVKKKKRNQVLLAELQNDDPEYVSIVQKKPQPNITSEKETPMPPAGGADFNRIKNSIKQANLCFNTLCENEAALPQKILKLKKFNSDFEKSVEGAVVSDDEFNELFEDGAPLLQKINKALPVLDRYSSNQLSFKDLPTSLSSKPANSRVKDIAPEPQKKEIVSQTKIEEKPKLEKVMMSEDISLKKVETLKKNQVETLKRQSIPHIEEKSLKAESIRGKVEQTSIKTESIKHRLQQNSLKTDTMKSKQEEVRRMGSQVKKAAAESPQVTPIKKNYYQQDESKSKSSLPEQSVVKSRGQNSVEIRHPHDQQFNILPESHKAIPSKEAKIQSQQQIKQSLFKAQASATLKPLIQHKSNGKIEEGKPGLAKKDDFNQLEQEEIEQDEIHNKPKNIDNVKGSYKLKQGSRREVEEVFRESRGSSQRGSRIDFQESKVSKAEANEEIDEEDVIMMPEINPLEVSYHDIGGLEEQLKENKELSFKKCFEAEKYLLGANKNAKMFWLEKDTLSLIKAGGGRRASRNKDSSISIPEMLSEKDRKYQEELRYVEEQKNRKIRQLERQINSLETEGKSLHLRIVEQDREIKSFKADSSVSNSRTKKNFYLEDQDQLFRAKVSQKNGRERDRSVYDEPRAKEPKCLEPQGKLISTRKYGDYFAAFTEEKRKKNLLKNKELLFKDETIEFGCMSRREGQTLFVTFYITPEKDLEGLIYTINPADQSLAIELEPRNIPSIRKKKQEKIVVTVNVRDLPYRLPEIEFLYNLDGTMASHKFTVPCSFHKLVHLEPITQKELAAKFEQGKNIIRGEEVPYSRKLLKNVEALTEYFPSGTLARRGQPNENGEVEFGGVGEWRRQRFWVRIAIKPSQFLCVQAGGDDLSTAVEFYIALVTSLLMKNLELSQLR